MAFGLTDGEPKPKAMPGPTFWLGFGLDPAIVAPVILANTPFEPVSVDTVNKYLSAARAWHIAQGWPPPLSEADLDRTTWSLRGLRNLQGTARTQPVRPPITLQMMRALCSVSTTLSTLAFGRWPLLGHDAVRGGFGSESPSFDPAKHLKRQDVFFGSDLDGKPYARLDLLSAKTALAGEIQHIFVVPQPGLCPWSHSPASSTMPKVMDVLGV
ncbi:hypothetical protein B0H14DRAFT_2631050 [Mycena olivaceomarginata]|nr:hypothetical protein B0H14DRAFT_2631050 [Mycena olivaceomarginata]